MTVDNGISLGNGKVIHATKAALLIHIDDTDKAVWIPLSQIHDDSEVFELGHEGDVVVTEWFSEKI